VTTGTSTEPLDAAAILAALDAYWADPQPERFSGKIPGRIAGSEWDQETPAGTANPYWEIVRQLPLDTSPMPWRTRPEPNTYVITDESSGTGLRYIADRHHLCGTFSWSICSPGDITWIKNILAGRGVVETGAGGGYWAWQMRQAGIDVAAYEPNQPEDNHHVVRTWTDLLRDDASAAARHPDRALFLCWPTYADPWAAHALSCYTGDTLIYAGEGEGGCTADGSFFDLLEAEWDEIGDCPAHISFWGIHCYLTAYRRKTAKEATP
jgi:hypothetical protein